MYLTLLQSIVCGTREIIDQCASYGVTVTRLLASGGMTLADVNFVNTTIPDAMAALSGGSVDCALLAGAAAYNMQSGGGHLVTNGKGLVDATICCATTQSIMRSI